MFRVNEIINNPKFEDYISKIEQLERERKFCRHGFDHALTVARIAHAYLLEQEDRTVSKDIVYAAGLLHDIGRWVEYETGKKHELAGMELAKPILEDCGYKPDEIETIVKAIGEHRRQPDEALSTLGLALALADDWARDCRSCAMHDSCYKFADSMLQIKF